MATGKLSSSLFEPSTDHNSSYPISLWLSKRDDGVAESEKVYCDDALQLCLPTGVYIIKRDDIKGDDFAAMVKRGEESQQASGSGVWCNTEQGTPGYGNW